MEKFIDPSYAPEESLLLRYHRGISFDGITRDDLEAVSVREGARILKLIDYRGVSVYLADESTLMSTGTFKALEACFIIAICKKKGFTSIVFSSGANLGSALTFYGKRTGIETFFFHPENASWKLDSALFDGSSSNLIAVDKTEKEVKRAAQLFAELSGSRHVPEMNWRFSATGLRALFVFEYMRSRLMRFDWVSQTVCAGYGPIGFYNMVRGLLAEGVIARESVPRFLGVQQEALSPMVRAWRNKRGSIESRDVAGPSPDLLDPSLYNTNPDTSYPILYKHLLQFGGELCPLGKDEYDAKLQLMLDALERAGIRPNKRVVDGTERFIENAGLINLSGTLKAIDDGVIRKGETVLSFFTGGAGAHSGAAPVPEYRLQRDDDMQKTLRTYVRKTAVPGT